MLTIEIPERELFDESTMSFLTTPKRTLQVEHSLVSISKWESKWHKPFLSKEDKTFAESVDYLRCMTITQNVPDEAYASITSDIITQMTDYIEAPMTATTFTQDKTSTNREVMTSEVLYYYMVALNIPFECQKWHLNRLITLINVCSIKSQPPKKMGRKELLSRNAALNAARRQQLNSKG